MGNGVTWKGTKGPTLLRDEWAFDPNVGWNVEREWSGDKSVIMGYINAFNTQRIRCRHRQDGPLHFVTAFYTYPDNLALFTEKWSAGTTALEVDIFREPDIFDWMESQSNPLAWRREIENAFNEARDIDDSIISLSDDVADAVLLELRRGASSFATEYLTVRRTRIVPRQFGTAMVIYPASYVFTPAQLPFPADVNFVIGTLPDTPAQTLWGFRRTNQTCEWAGDRIEMSVEFTLADWSTLLYTASPSNFTG